MIALLADHNIERNARLLFATLHSLGWTELLDLRLLAFADVGLVYDSPDRDVWRRVQEVGAILITGNRQKAGPDSLEQTLIDEVTPASLPVITVGNAERVMRDSVYCTTCAKRIVEILMDLDLFRGASRLYVP